MPKQFPLDKYIKAVEALVERHSLYVELYQGKGSAIGFQIFSNQEKSGEPLEMWVVHTTHGKWRSRKIWSKDDLKKPALHIQGATQEEFESFLDK